MPTLSTSEPDPDFHDLIEAAGRVRSIEDEAAAWRAFGAEHPDRIARDARLAATYYRAGDREALAALLAPYLDAEATAAASAIATRLEGS